MLKRVIVFIISLFIFGSITTTTYADTASNYTVTIENSQFNPVEIDIAPGQSVTWINHDSIAHTATSDVTGTTDSWDSGTISPHGEYTKTFSTAGTYTYHCKIHPAMKATVKVIEGFSTSTQELPRTGPSLLTWLLIAAFPIGFILLKITKKVISYSPYQRWLDNQNKKLQDKF